MKYSPRAQRLLERWTLLQADVEHRLRNYWDNVLISFGIIALWFLAATVAVNNATPFEFLLWINRDTTRLGVACLAAVAVAIAFCASKPEDARGRTLIIAIGWLVIMGGVWTSYTHSSPAGPSIEGALPICLHLYRLHPTVLAAWWGVLSMHRLKFIFAGHRAKLKAYWICLLTGFASLTVGYAISPELAFLASLTIPQEWFNRYLDAAAERDVIIRGPELITAKEANYQHRRGLNARSRLQKEVFSLGEVMMPIANLVYGLMVIGSRGSGKTLTLRKVMQAVLPTIIPAGTEMKRALVYDPMQTMIPIIMGITNFAGNLKILNPLDRRCCWYDMAADFTDMFGAQAVGKILAPEGKPGQHQDPFFHSAAEGLITAVAMAFINNAPGNWRLADLVRAFKDETTVRAVIGSDSQALYYFSTMGNEKTTANIISSVCVEVLKFMPLAAIWEHASEKVSVKQWMEQPGEVWILAQNPKALTTMQALNRLIIERMSQCLLSEGQSKDLAPRTYIFLDELISIHIELLDKLIIEGRSKGIAFCGAFQSIQGLYKTYGKESADSILGQIRYKAFLKLSDDITADYASRQFGSNESKRTQATTDFEAGAAGHLPWSKRKGGSQVIQDVKLVLPSEIMHLEEINPAQNIGMSGFYIAGKQLFGSYTPWDKLWSSIQPENEYVSAFEEAPAAWQRLEPWTEDNDWERLGIAKEMRKIGSKKASATPDSDDSSSYGGRYHY